MRVSNRFGRNLTGSTVGRRNALAVVGAVLLLAAAWAAGWLVWLALAVAALVAMVVTRGAILVFIAVVLWRWLSGGRLWGGGYGPATFRRSAAPPVRKPLQFGVRINWAYWPGWQRAVVRWLFAALVMCATVAPELTGWVIAGVATAFTAAIGAVRYRAAVLRLDRAPERPVVAAADIAGELDRSGTSVHWVDATPGVVAR